MIASIQLNYFIDRQWWRHCSELSLSVPSHIVLFFTDTHFPLTPTPKESAATAKWDRKEKSFQLAKFPKKENLRNDV